MGSLHHYVDPTKDPKLQTAMIQRDREKNSRVTRDTTSHARFVPRPALLDSRKRKAEETISQSSRVNSDEGGCVIGPQLPEKPKMDLEDASLNITANIIRSTMAKVRVLITV